MVIAIFPLCITFGAYVQKETRKELYKSVNHDLQMVIALTCSCMKKKLQLNFELPYRKLYKLGCCYLKIHAFLTSHIIQQPMMTNSIKKGPPQNILYVVIHFVAEDRLLKLRAHN